MGLAVTVSARAKQRLETFLTKEAGAKSTRVVEFRALSGGAIQENWLLDAEFFGGPFAGLQKLVLRRDSPSGVAVSLTRPQEFAVLSAAWHAGVSVPEPLWLNEDESVFGKPFYIMRRVAGAALARRIVKDTSLGPIGPQPAPTDLSHL